MPNTHASTRTALCHEWVTTFGGSEQVAQRIATALDVERVFTVAAEPSLAKDLFADCPVEVIASWGRRRLGKRHWQWFLPLMPHAWKELDLSDYDLVVTSSHACVNAIRVAPGARHVSYCHTPLRYAWEWQAELDRFPDLVRPFWPAIANRFRRWDRRWAQRVDLFIANSRHVADRISRYYGRDSVVLPPPIDTQFWKPADVDVKHEEFFLFAGRFVAYKRADVAIEAAKIAGAPLVIAGSGPQLDLLKKIAGPMVTFVEQPTRSELRDLYRRATALVCPGVEDFGMTAVEAQACGTPVIALARGGAVESVIDGKTGLLYEDANPSGLAHALRAFRAHSYELTEMRANAERFDSSRFDDRLREIIAGVDGGSVSVPAPEDF